MLVLPQSAPAMSMAMLMMKPMLPQMREARREMQALKPAEQEELAASLALELDQFPAGQRKRMLAELGGGLLPARVVDLLNKR